VTKPVKGVPALVMSVSGTEMLNTQISPLGVVKKHCLVWPSQLISWFSN